MYTYNHKNIEIKWQKFWDKNKCFQTELNSSKPKFYALDMFPYPSGAGLHVGHPEGYTASDIVCRYKRMKGFNVLHPMGWDAFGLPAEKYAIKTGQHPKTTTTTNIDNFKKQIKSLGFSYDWEREINTTDVDYYRWTQWLFIKLYEKGLAYIDTINVNWCPILKTVLANEEVHDGYSEEGYAVEKRPMRQWVLKITKYSERLLNDLEELDWPESIKEMQRNWIGKSSGTEVVFSVTDSNISFKIFTTRIDTLFGSTYIAIAPEQDLVNDLTSQNQKKAVQDYLDTINYKSDLERTEGKNKTGVFTGSYAINPVNGNKLPIWIADYVFASYGTGVIMAVPAHDERDFEFAKKFNLPIKCVIKPSEKDAQQQNLSLQNIINNKSCWTGKGTLINSSSDHSCNINDLNIEEAQKKLAEWLQINKFGETKTNYKIRDWIFSRQRYWGEPFPIVHMNDGSIKILDINELPVILPEIDNYEPNEKGNPPLANADKQWLEYTCKKTGKKGIRETNTMPQWAGSCWYYLRYIDPFNQNLPFDKKLADEWLPVDLYIGGAEHAVLHLLYARFWHKVFYDIGLVSNKEPFQKLFNQGLILAVSYKNKAGFWVDTQLVVDENSQPIPANMDLDKNKKFFHKETGEELIQMAGKMSKSLNNVVNPDDIVEKYGADSLRLYEMFIGDLSASKLWSTKNVEGIYRFINRVWRLVIDEQTGQIKSTIRNDSKLKKENLKVLHQTIKKVSEDIENFSFNTAISQMMIFVNEFTKLNNIPRSAIEKFLKLLSPFAPHICEELWNKLGNKASLSKETWPNFEEKYLIDDEVEILVQILGKPIKKLMVANNLEDKIIEELIKNDKQIKEKLAEKTILKFIIVPNRLVNIVAK